MAMMMIVGALVALVIGALFGGLLLWLTATLFKLEGGFVKALLIALYVSLVNFVFSLIQAFTGQMAALGILSFIIGVVLAVYLINKEYDTGVGKAILVWLVWAVFVLVIGGIIAAIAVFTIGAALLGGLTMM